MLINFSRPSRRDISWGSTQAICESKLNHVKMAHLGSRCGGLVARARCGCNAVAMQLQEAKKYIKKDKKKEKIVIYSEI